MVSSPSPRTTLARVIVSGVLVLAGLEGVFRLVSDAAAAPAELMLLHLALGFVAFDLAVGAVLVHAVFTRLRQPEQDEVEGVALPSLSVLLPAFNEGAHLRSTVEAWAGQTGVTFELLVGDDGSLGDDASALALSLGLEAEGPRNWRGEVKGVPVRLFRFEHAGKGATLNALARRARHPVLVTIDADTRPTSGSLRRLSAAFVDPEVDLATGVVSLSNGRGGWLLGNQSAEYLKNAFARIAWSTLDALEQVPGAFTAIRACVFHDAGGFPDDSLTEDYELSFRCMALGVRRGRPPHVVTVLRAQVFTEGPSTVRGFIAQRTRWFAGFLSTLFRFRHLVFRAGTGTYGLVRLPLKVLDAVLPLWAFASLLVLVRGGLDAALHVTQLSLALFAIRWVWDGLVYGFALWASPRLGAPDETARAAPPSLVGWLLTSLEALTYVWLKHAAALRGVVWAVARVRRWEASRVVET